MARTLTNSLRGLNNPIYLPRWNDNCGSNPSINAILDAIDTNSGTILVSATDGTLDTLANKLIAGQNITITKTTDAGGEEHLTIAVSGVVSGGTNGGTLVANPKPLSIGFDRRLF